MSRGDERRRPEGRLPNPAVTTTTDPQDSGQVYEWRLTVHRKGWERTYRYYHDRSHVMRDVDTLLEGDQTDSGRYPPVLFLHVDRRKVVSSWELFTLWKKL